MEAKNKEVFGNITLNLDYYSGEDLYSEGPAEDMLLDLVTRYSENDYEHVIQNSRSWNVMYHLSHIRENIVSWIPISRNSRILEVGSGCGAVTGAFAKLANHVDCIELSKKRSQINAVRHKEFDNIDIIVGNFEDIEPNLTEKYDYITLIGVLEYAESYIHAENPYEALIEKMSAHLNPGGKILIAIENKFGLKYFAGCKEDHTGRYFEGIEGYKTSEGVKTFSKESLGKMATNLGFNVKYYYPYPDYKLPHTIFSDDSLPKAGELTTNLRNYDNDRVVLFDESRVFDTMIEEGTFDFFSNSFFLILTKEDIYDTLKVVPIYAKYANERQVDHRVATILYKTKDGRVEVFKCAANHASNEHLKRIESNYQFLLKQYEGTKLLPNKCDLRIGKEPVPLVVGATSKSIDVMGFDYIEGESMEKYLIDLHRQERYLDIESLIRQYIDTITSISGKVPFRETEKFRKVFGNVKFDSSYTGASGSDYDIIFSNIMFDKNDGPAGTWNVLDYEWCFDFPVPDRFLAFRGLYYHFEFSDTTLKSYYESTGRNVYSMFGFTEDEVRNFIEMEHNFQVYIIGGVASLEVLHSMMPTNTVFLDNVLRESNALKNLNNPKIYYSYGEGYSDDRRVYIIPKVDGPSVEVDIPLASNMRGIRLDPTEYDSIVSVKDIYMTDSAGNRTYISKFLMNGYMLSEKTIIYNTDDPQIIIEDIQPGMSFLHISYDVAMFLPEMYEDIKNLAISKQEMEYQRPGVVDRALMKLHLKKRPIPLPEGYHYNVVIK